MKGRRKFRLPKRRKAHESLQDNTEKSLGESFVVTVTASSLYEAMKMVNFTPGWHFAEYSVIGGAI